MIRKYTKLKFTLKTYYNQNHSLFLHCHYHCLLQVLKGFLHLLPAQLDIKVSWLENTQHLLTYLDLKLTIGLIIRHLEAAKYSLYITGVQNLYLSVAIINHLALRIFAMRGWVTMELLCCRFLALCIKKCYQIPRQNKCEAARCFWVELCKCIW